MLSCNRKNTGGFNLSNILWEAFELVDSGCFFAIQSRANGGVNWSREIRNSPKTLPLDRSRRGRCRRRWSRTCCRWRSPRLWQVRARFFRLWYTLREIGSLFPLIIKKTTFNDLKYQTLFAGYCNNFQME